MSVVIGAETRGSSRRSAKVGASLGNFFSSNGRNRSIMRDLTFS